MTAPTPKRGPSLFIVGAPKCGTSWASQMLDAHPDAFMPTVKEPHRFGSDLTPRNWSRDPETYFGLYDEAGERPGVDASTFYLSSSLAAAEIREFDPQARILIMLRHPLAVVESLHAQLLFDGTEDIDDVDVAIAAAPDRRRGDRIPADCIRPEALDYPHVVRFGEHVERYLNAFGPEQVLVLFHDELKADAVDVRRRILDHFGLDPARGELPGAVNERKEIRSKRLRSAYRSIESNEQIKTVLRRVLSPSLRWQIAHRIKMFNSKPADRQHLSAATQAELLAGLRDDVAKLEAMLGVDLDEWKRPLGERGAGVPVDR